MRAVRTLVLAVAMAAVASTAQAQKIDLSKASCKDFLESGQNGIVMIWAWLYGYYSDQDADPIIDFDDLTKMGTKLAEDCRANPSKGLIDTAEPIYEKK
jgi:acid stress chaperone HdeB